MLYSIHARHQPATHRVASAFVWRILWLTLVAAAPFAAYADSLPASTATASIYDSSTGTTIYSNFPSPSVPCVAEGGASACAGFGPNSSVSASSYDPTVLPGASVLYSFEILNPGGAAGSFTVPITITGSASVSITYGGLATGGVSLQLYSNSCCNQTLLNYHYNNPTSANPTGTFTENTTWSSNFASQLVVEVGCSVDSISPGATCQSAIDPTITIDNSSGNYTGYTLIEDGAEFPSTVPVPGTLMLLGSGLLGLVGMCFRRNQFNAITTRPRVGYSMRNRMPIF